MPKAKSSPGSRYDSSLGLLTKKFVTLIQESPEGLLDLNQAATTLEVQKRRIYDITNVLEGIGLIEKKGKNNIQWKGSGPATNENVQQRVDLLRHEINRLREEEKVVDDYVAQMTELVQQAMRDQEAKGDKSLAYVTHADITSIPQYKDETVVAVKAPAGTTLEVPGAMRMNCCASSPRLLPLPPSPLQVDVKVDPVAAAHPISPHPDPDEDTDENLAATGQRRYQIFLRTESEKGIETHLVNSPADGRGMTTEVVSNAMGEDGAAEQKPDAVGQGAAELPIKMESVEPLQVGGSFDLGAAEAHVDGIDDLFSV